MYSYKILQNWTNDMFHSSILSFDKKSYLFNCSDGTQRNLSSQNIKFSKISHIFFNSSSIDAYLGCYGFSMSRNEQISKPLPLESNTEEGKISKNKNSNQKLKEIKKEKTIEDENLHNLKLKSYLVPLMEGTGKPLYFWGPSPIRSNFDYCKYFFVERVKDYIYEYNPITNRFELKIFNKSELSFKNLENEKINNENKINVDLLNNNFNTVNELNKQINLNLTEPDIFLEFFEDENLKIYPITSVNPLIKKNVNEKIKQENSEYALSYFCEPHLKTRSFLPEKAKALGLKPGPGYAQLQNGQNVFLDGKEIKPEDVLGDQMPSSCVAILFSPTTEHAKNLLDNLKNLNYKNFFFQKNELKTISIIVHILGDSQILLDNDYKNFINEINNIHKDVLHILDCKDTNYKFMINEEKHRIKYLLSNTDEKIYKLGYFQEKETLPKFNLNEFFSSDLLEKYKNIINSNSGFEYNLYPIHRKGIINSKIYEPFIYDKRNAKFLNFIKQADKIIDEHRKSDKWELSFQKEKEFETQIFFNDNNLKNLHKDIEMKIEEHENQNG